MVRSYRGTRPKIRSCWKQDAAMLLGQHCSMLSTILFGIVTPDCGLIQAQQYCSILLTTRNNVAPTTLLHPVFNNLLQLIIFCRVVHVLECELSWSDLMFCIFQLYQIQGGTPQVYITTAPADQTQQQAQQAQAAQPAQQTQAADTEISQSAEQQQAQ